MKEGIVIWDKTTSHTENLCQQLRQFDLVSAEYQYRVDQLRWAEKEDGSFVSPINDSYFQLAHEIKSAIFLKNFGRIRFAEDYRHQPGCDYILSEHYQIECVCCSAGNAAENGLAPYFLHDNSKGLIDYRKKEELIFSRLTSSIKEKRDFFQNHVIKGTISSEFPYIIFLSLGVLSEIVPYSENGINFNGILLGKGKPTVTINTQTREIDRVGYSFCPYIDKWNKQKINSNIFGSEEYRCVSGIIISHATVFEEYSSENTFLFLNPYAFCKIKKKDFWGITYWAADKNMTYRAYRKGRALE